jgi:hypothetical protein
LSCSERRGLSSPFSSPLIYQTIHHVRYEPWLKQFTRDVIQPTQGIRSSMSAVDQEGCRIYLPVSTAYIGFERNRACIEGERRKHRARGEFIYDDLANR